jgi:hypothetical protein
MYIYIYIYEVYLPEEFGASEKASDVRLEGVQFTSRPGHTLS